MSQQLQLQETLYHEDVEDLDGEVDLHRVSVGDSEKNANEHKSDLVLECNLHSLRNRFLVVSASNTLQPRPVHV